MRYEFEDYFTKERKIEDTKEECIINISELICNINASSTLSLILDEFIFADYYLKKGYRVYRLPLSYKNPAFMYDEINFGNLLKLNIDCCTKVGCPDFLVLNWNNKEYFFVEVKKRDNMKKSDENSLNKNQVEWADNNKDKKIIIARVIPFKEK